MRALSRKLGEALGPDCSEVAFVYDDGWSIRRLTTIEDQRREGELMHHCMRGVTILDENTWSLRDADNLPHLTFSVWLTDASVDLSEILAVNLSGVEFMHAGDALFLIGADRLPKEEHVDRLRVFGRAGVADHDDVPELPADRRGQIQVIAEALAPAVNPFERDRVLRSQGFA